MSDTEQKFTGLWLHYGDWRGRDFTHALPEYDHAESPEGAGSTPMRHAHVTQEGKQIAVWVPADWSDEQASAALETDW